MELHPGRMSAIPPMSRYAFETTGSFPNRPHTSSNNFPDRKKKNPFFYRNNPHPNKVCHMKGLLDIPVCVVYDFEECNDVPVRQKTRGLIGGLPLKREKFVPGIGMVNTQPAWFEELQNFTQKVGLKTNQIVTLKPFENNIGRDENISKDRIPSRLSSRQSNPSVVNSPRSRLSSRSSRRSSALNKMENDFIRQQCLINNKNNNPSRINTHNPSGKDVCNVLRQDLAGNSVIQVENKEGFVFHLLIKILQTDSLDDIKQWLLQAPSKEKETVLEMVRALSNSNQTMEGQIIPEMNYDTNFLYHESSLDPEVFQLQQERKFSPRNHVLEQIQESIQLDVNRNEQKQSPSLSRNVEGFLPRISSDHAEIEEIRSRLVSRGSLNVLGTPRK